MPKRSRTFRNFKKQGNKYTNILRSLIDQRKTNVVRKTLGFASRTFLSRSKNRSKKNKSKRR